MRHLIKNFFSLGLFGITLMLVGCRDETTDTPTPTRFSLSIPEGYTISDERQMWFMLSDENGNLLDVQQASPGITIIFKIPEDFRDQQFTLTKFDARKESATVEYYGLESFTQMKAGEYSLPTYKPYSRSQSKDFKATISGLKDSDYVTVSGAGMNGWSVTDGDYTGTKEVVSNLSAAKANLVYTINNYNDPTVQLYKYVPGATGDESVTLQKKDFVLMTKQTIQLDKKYPSGYAIVNGFSSADTKSTSFPITSIYSIIQPNVSGLNIFYPGNSFPAYETVLSVSTAKEGWDYTKKGIIPTEFKKLPVILQSISLSNNKITGIKSGSFDYFTAYMMSTIFEGERYYSLRWNVHHSDANDNVSVTLPEIPNQILEQFPNLREMPQMVMSSVSVSESNGLNSYGDFLELTFNKPGEEVTNTSTEKFGYSQYFK